MLQLGDDILQKTSHRPVIKKKYQTCDCHMPKQRFADMACDSKSHAIILWRVINVKLNIGKKITGLEIMTLNCKKFSMLPNLLNWRLRGSHTVYRNIWESRGHLNLTEVFLCVAHTNVFTSKYYTIQWISTNRNFT